MENLDRLFLPVILLGGAFVGLLVLVSWLVDHVLKPSEKARSVIVVIAILVAIIAWAIAVYYVVSVSCDDVDPFDVLDIIFDR